VVLCGRFLQGEALKLKTRRNLLTLASGLVVNRKSTANQLENMKRMFLAIRCEVIILQYAFIYVENHYYEELPAY
jgi:hypothetical protein